MVAGMTPSLTSESWKTALSVATTMSQTEQMPTPPPKTGPATRLRAAGGSGAAAPQTGSWETPEGLTR